MKTILILLLLACCGLAIAQVVIRSDVSLTAEQTIALEAQRAAHNAERARTNGPALTAPEFLAVRAAAAVDADTGARDNARLTAIVRALRAATPARRDAVLPPLIRRGQWNFVTISIPAGDTFTVSLNGVTQSTVGTQYSWNGTGPLTIGGGPVEVKELAIWDHAFTPAESTALWNSYNTPPPAPKASVRTRLKK